MIIFFSNILNHPKPGVIITDISDHFPLFTTFPFVLNSPSSQHTGIPTRHYSHDNLANLKQELLSRDWTPVLHADDANSAFINFMNNFQASVDKQIPITQNKPKARKLIPKSPWVTPSLCKSINHKNKLYHSYVANPTDSSRYKYVHYKNILINVLRNSTLQYYSQQFERERLTLKILGKLLTVSFTISYNQKLM